MNHRMQVIEPVSTRSVFPEHSDRLDILDHEGFTAGTVTLEANQVWGLSIEPEANAYDVCWALAEYWETTPHPSRFSAGLSASRTSLEQRDDILFLTQDGAALAEVVLETGAIRLLTQSTTEAMFLVAAVLWREYERKGTPEHHYAGQPIRVTEPATPTQPKQPPPVNLKARIVIIACLLATAAISLTFAWPAFPA